MDGRTNNFPPIFKWTQVRNPPGPQPRPRHGHRAVAIKNLMVVFGGGNEGLHEGINAFDTDCSRWYIPPIRRMKDLPHRAAFGFVVLHSTRIILFGGMIDQGDLSNDVYELQASRWEWKKLRLCNESPLPCARLGHSFSLKGKDIYMFGGVTFHKDTPKDVTYLNDLFMLELRDNGRVMWHPIAVDGPVPPPRESHSAVIYTDTSGFTKLIIYGGMNGGRLGDLWTFHFSSMRWTKELLCGNVPLPRSLHTAAVMSHRMFVFGGWVPRISNEKKTVEWICSNELACLNLETMVWEKLLLEADEESLPKGRAGHSAVAINGRIYIWSGRDGYMKAWNNQICCKDLWYLEVEKPAAVQYIQLISSTTNSLCLTWPRFPCVDHYILQIQQYPNTAVLPMEDISLQRPPPMPSPPQVTPPKPLNNTVQEPLQSLNSPMPSSCSSQQDSHAFTITSRVLAPPQPKYTSCTTNLDSVSMLQPTPTPSPIIITIPPRGSISNSQTAMPTATSHVPVACSADSPIRARPLPATPNVQPPPLHTILQESKSQVTSVTESSPSSPVTIHHSLPTPVSQPKPRPVALIANLFTGPAMDQTTPVTTACHVQRPRPRFIMLTRPPNTSSHRLEGQYVRLKKLQKGRYVVLQKGQDHKSTGSFPKLFSVMNKDGQKVMYNMLKTKPGQGQPKYNPLGGERSQPTKIVLAKPKSTVYSSPVPQGTRIITVKRPITIQVPNSMPYQPVASGESMVQSPPAHTANGGSSEGVESGCANETVVLGISEPQIHYECKGGSDTIPNTTSQQP